MYGTPEHSSYPKFYKTSILICESLCTYQRKQVELKDLSLKSKQLHQSVVGDTYNLSSDIPQIIKLSPETSKEWRVAGSHQSPASVAAEGGNIAGTSRTEAQLHKSLPTLLQWLKVSESSVVVLEEIIDTKSSRDTIPNLSKTSGHKVYCCQVDVLTKNVDDAHLSCYVCATKKTASQ